MLVGSTPADNKSIPENDSFSCMIRVDEVFKPYALGQPINVCLNFQHQLEGDIILSDHLRQSDIFSFEIKDEHGHSITTRQQPTNDRVFDYSRIEPGRQVETCIDIANWYEILDVGTYTIQAKWQIDTKQQLYSGKSNLAPIKVVTPEDKEIFDLIRQAFLPSASEGYGPAYYQLVQIGPRVVPVLLEWLNMRKKGQIPSEEFHGSAELVDILSQIGTNEAYHVIKNFDGIDERRKRIFLKYVDICQSDNLFERLIGALDDKDIGRKWVIFKLGVLGDKRAMGILEPIALNDASMDIRETAKEALSHLRNPNSAMPYIMHRHSESIELQTAKDQYRIGEKIKITFTLTGGRYGSNKLIEYSNPGWQFLPWGRPGGVGSIFILRMSVDFWDNFMLMQDMLPGMSHQPDPPYGMAKRGEMIPVKELIENKRYLEETGYEPLEGYAELSDLGNATTFTLQYGQTKIYEIEDLNNIFHITQPAKYNLYVRIRGKSSIRSNKLIITILPSD